MCYQLTGHLHRQAVVKVKVKAPLRVVADSRGVETEDILHTVLHSRQI